MLSLPSVIQAAFPLAEFAAVAYVCHRLITESEMVILQTTGYSPWRIARPFLAFGLFAAILMSILTHMLVPKSLEQLQLRTKEISQSVTAKLLTDGTFLHPTKGITFYIREITPEGILEDVFLADNREGGTNTVFTASEAYLVKEDEGTKLVMVNGMAQSLTTDGRLSITNFKDFTYDVGNMIGGSGTPRPNIAHLPTYDLLFKTLDVQAASGASLGRIMEQAHGRIAQALFCLIVAILTCSTMIQGSFSRFGPGRYVVAGLVLLIFLKFVESAIFDPVRADATNWWMMYLPPAIGVALYLVQQLNNADTFGLRSRRRSAA